MVEPRQAATTRSAPGATYVAAGARSAQPDAPLLFSPPFVALAARLDPLPWSPSTRLPITGQNLRPEDRAFLQGSVAFLARTPRSIFALDEAISVMHSAQALLLRVSGGKPPFGRRGVAPGPCGQLGRTLLSEVMARLVTSLRAAPDHCAMAAIWPTPEQDQEYLERRALAAGGDNNSGDRDGSGGGGHHHRGGRVGGHEPGGCSWRSA